MFLNRQTGNGIIIWDRLNEDGTQLRIPVELSFRVQPRVETEIEYSSQSRKFHYTFTLINGKAGRQPINFFYFVNLQDKGRYQVSMPDRWYVTFPAHIAQLNRENDQLDPVDRALILVSPDADKSGVIGVPPGKIRGGFQILSPDRPGLIDVYA